MARPKSDYAQQLHRHKWRESIDIAKCLATLQKVDLELISNWKQLDSPEVNALRLLCDNQFRKLGKVMPDIKAVELSGEVNITNFKLKAGG